MSSAEGDGHCSWLSTMHRVNTRNTQAIQDKEYKDSTMTLKDNRIPANLPTDFRYVLCDGHKRPYDRQWQNLGLKLDQVLTRLSEPRFKGLGVLCGPQSDGLLVLDVDGKKGWELVKTYSGLQHPEKTVTIEGSPGSAKFFYRVPKHLWDRIHSRKFLEKAEGHDEGIEILWNGRQAIVAGAHPTAGKYSFWPECSFEKIEVQPAPAWILDLAFKPLVTDRSVLENDSQSDSSLERVQELLEHIPLTDWDDYETWTTIGMALHHTGDYLSLYDRFSQNSSKYPGYASIQRKWLSFASASGHKLSIKYIYKLAIKNGWKNKKEPFKNHREPGREPARTYTGKGLDTKSRIPQKSLTPREIAMLEEEVFGEQLEYPMKSLPDALVEIIDNDARLAGTVPAAYAQNLLAASASQMGCSFLEMGNFAVPNILWTANIQESGGGKTRAYGAVVGPIQKLQAKEVERFGEELEEHDAAKKRFAKDPQGNSPKRPKLKTYYIESTTGTALQRRIAGNGDMPLLYGSDELSAMVDSQNQFTGGKGEDHQIWLRAWDGQGVNVTRAREEDCISSIRSRVSVTGGFQPVVFKRMFPAESTETGFQARFLLAKCPILQSIYSNGTGRQLTTHLENHFYPRLRNVFGTFTLAPKAQKLWERTYNRIGELKVQKKYSSSRFFLRKLDGHIARLALVLHAMEYASGKEKYISNQVSDSTLKKAIELGNYYYKSIKQLNEENDEDLTDGFAEILSKINNYCKARECPISSRQIARLRYVKNFAKEQGQRNIDFTKSAIEVLAEKNLGSFYVENKVYYYTPRENEKEREKERDLKKNGSPCPSHTQQGFQPAPQAFSPDSRVAPKNNQGIENEKTNTKNTERDNSRTVQIQAKQARIDDGGSGLGGSSCPDPSGERGTRSEQAPANVEGDAVGQLGQKRGERHSEIPSQPREEVRTAEREARVNPKETFLEQGLFDTEEYDPHEDHTLAGDAYWEENQQ